jgi:molybdopterin converting factor small subunit
MGGRRLRITLQTISELAHHFGSGEVKLELTCSTVRELLEYIKARYQFDFTAQKYTMLFVNGRGCVDLSHTLKNGDHVAIVPIMAAG